MFFYISFLRPPPIKSPPHSAILFTPQISNDLRTELFDGSQDLYFSWVLESPTGSNHDQAPSLSTKPTKLTAWRPSSAYKEIPVQPPPNVREGQQWSLVLTCQAQGYGTLNPESIDLRRSDVGEFPFPVRSMPVLFTAKASKGKQEMIERTYLLPFPGESSPGAAGGAGKEGPVTATLRFTEKTSFDLDKKIWDSGIGLSSWLCELGDKACIAENDTTLLDLHSTLFSKKQCRILELGAGIGIVSIALAVLRCSLTPSNSDSEIEKDKDVILTTDVSSAIPLLEQNISSNSKYYLSETPQALVLDWDDEDLPGEVSDLGGLDIIVMADVSYNTASFPALSQTLSKLIRLGPKPPIIVLGYKERDEAERTFWNMASEVGIRFTKVGERQGAGGAPVEIWVGLVQIQE